MGVLFIKQQPETEMKNDATVVRVHKITDKLIENIQARANKLRLKNNLPPFNKMQTIDFLVRNSKIEDCIK